MTNNAPPQKPVPYLSAANAIIRPFRSYPNVGRDQPCCNKAQKVFCVCRVSYNCPDHGSRCHGSHD